MTGPSGASGEPGPGRLRLATGNAASGRRLGRTYEIDPWARAAAALQADVLAVQEVDHLLPRSGHQDQTSRIAAALTTQGQEGDRSRSGTPWTARFAPAVLGTPGSHRTMRPTTAAPASRTLASELEASGGYGVALLSRHPVEEWHELRMAPSKVPMPVPDEQRAAVAAVLRTPTGRLTVVTTHLSFVPLRARAQLKELLTWARPLPRPLVLMGDLNLPAPAPERISGWTPGLRAATFPAAAPLVQLDHVLLDPGDASVGSTARLMDASTVRLPGTDHLAVRADLLLR